MAKPNIDDYLNQGIYGKKESKPDERKKFLGSLRERVVLALTKEQVKEQEVLTEAIEALKKHKSARLLLNGNMDYQYLSKYVKLSEKCGIEYTIVTNKEYDSDLGFVLAYNHAINKDDIYIKNETISSKKAETQTKKGFLSVFNIFRKSKLEK